jgi:glutathione S-transferase
MVSKHMESEVNARYFSTPPHHTDPLFRYSLNYKGLPYRTEWVEFPDIEAHCKAIGASATSTNADGSPFYTLPVIKDLSTGAVVSESAAIAKYLDDTYPSTPALFVDSESISQLAFIQAHGDATKELWDFALPRIKLHPVSDAYLRRTKEPLWGKKMEDISPIGEEKEKQWGRLKEDWGRLAGRFPEDKTLVLGDRLSFADIVVVAHVALVKRLMPEEWDEVRTWHGGRWAAMLDHFEQHYSTVM